MKYLGPVDGHDTAAMEAALRRAKAFGGPVIVHAVTVKGYGYQPAVDDEADCLHSVAPVTDPVTGKPITAERARLDQRARRGDGRDRRRAARRRRDHRRDAAAGRAARASARPTPSAPSTSASPSSTPSRRAAGLAMGGMHPVVCLYATFLNRAFDQALMDVALHRLPVTFVLDRAGVTGEDGAEPQRHVGPVAAAARARACASPRPRDARDAARGAARGGRRRRRPDRRALPQGRGRRRHPGARAARRRRRAAARAGRRRAARRRRRDGAARRSRSPSAPPRRASASPSSTRAGSAPVPPELVELAAVVPPGRHASRTTAASAASARWSRQALRDADVDVPAARHRHPAALPRPRAPGPQVLAEIGLTAAGGRPPGRRDRRAPRRPRRGRRAHLRRRGRRALLAAMRDRFPTVHRWTSTKT